MREFGQVDESLVRFILKKVLLEMGNCPPGEILPVVSQSICSNAFSEFIEKMKQDIVETGKHLYSLGFLAGTSGNISVRLPDNSILITASGINKGRLGKEHILRIDMGGSLMEDSTERPSSETKMHLAAYKKRVDVKGVVHTHPPYATGFAAAGLALDMPVLPEAILVLGRVPLVEYATPSTGEVPEGLNPYLEGRNAFLLQNHGALTLGVDLNEASHRMETLELFSKVLFIARTLGGEKVLSRENLEKLLQVHNRAY